METEGFAALILENSPSAMIGLMGKLPDFILINESIKTPGYHQAMSTIHFRNAGAALVGLCMPKENGSDYCYI